jgi:hypothetical protein
MICVKCTAKESKANQRHDRDLAALNCIQENNQLVYQKTPIQILKTIILNLIIVHGLEELQSWPNRERCTIERFFFSTQLSVCRLGTPPDEQNIAT